MAQEIERKFLITSEAWQAHADAGQRMRQGYLVGAERASIRVRTAADQAWLNIKSATLGVERQEYEYAIPLTDAEEILATLCTPPLIEKTRYAVRWGAHTWEIDVFEGDNAGLVVAEIELASADEPFERPPWVGREVSDDPKYYNVCLVHHPYSQWKRESVEE
ncbi:adenylate cyclase [Halorhodospira abdelmalekii]|uniref:CYTH domain-containing protein n=1 Tax=Halorhodospira abdelmalekii TaxID=421629 RepID=UPI0019066CA7|nr:CYTH domain-containing protein [Halorhodospira abdelmalekii]MBK1734487.1 adenylate cyclase [Halorhodospira abdelmalekii]